MRGGASCEACTSQNTQYEWKISHQTSPDVWKEVAAVDNILSTSRFGNTLAVKSGTLNGGTTYKFRLESWVRGAQTRGFSEYIKEVNRPPYGGHCDITSRHADTPKLGFAFQDDFVISCSGWQDDTKLTYSITARSDDNQPELPVSGGGVASAGQNFITPRITLGVGLSTKDYWIDVYVMIKDEDGADTKEPLTVQVRKNEIQ